MVDNVDYVFWHEEGVYRYQKDGKWTLIENGKVVVDNVDYVFWYEEGVYRYKKAGKMFEVIDVITNYKILK